MCVLSKHFLGRQVSVSQLVMAGKLRFILGYITFEVNYNSEKDFLIIKLYILYRNSKRGQYFSIKILISLNQTLPVTFFSSSSQLLDVIMLVPSNFSCLVIWLLFMRPCLFDSIISVSCITQILQKCWGEVEHKLQQKKSRFAKPLSVCVCVCV